MLGEKSSGLGNSNNNHDLMRLERVSAHSLFQGVILNSVKSLFDTLVSFELDPKGIVQIFLK